MVNNEMESLPSCPGSQFNDMNRWSQYSVMGVKTEMGCRSGVHKAGAPNAPKSEGTEASGKTS